MKLERGAWMPASAALVLVLGGVVGACSAQAPTDSGDSVRVQSAVNTTVTVTVKNTSNAAQVGVNVDAQLSSTTVASATTNSQGKATFSLAAGTYKFRTAGLGTGFYFTSSNCTTPSCTTSTITTTIPVVITVADPSGTRKTNVEVLVVDSAGHTANSGFTDSNGQVSLSAKQGSYRFATPGSGQGFFFYSATSTNCTIPGCTTASITWTQPVTVTVVNASGTAQANTEVVAQDSGGNDINVDDTDAQGHVSLSVPVGTYTFGVIGDGTVFSSASCTVAGCTAASITLPLPTLVTVVSKSGFLNPNQAVLVQDASGNIESEEDTDTHGVASFLLAPGQHRFETNYGGTYYTSGALGSCVTPSCQSALILYDPCVTNADCGGSQVCAGGMCCNSACNGGCGSCLIPGHFMTCTAIPSGTTCRASAGACDVAESCNGSSLTCPTNGFASSSTVCRASAGACDAAETCTGTSAACPSDAFASASTVCRAAAGACDIAETCTGSSAACPSDAFASASTVCRAVAGACDVAETCTGSSATCPANAFASASTTCRAAAGACDVAEACTGSSAACPADAFASTSTVCRASAGACDVAETCTGSSATCPSDTLAATSTVCRPSAGACDVAETCTGSSATCPADAFASASTVCRSVAGACDAAESCSGSSATCPADVFATAGTVCRTANGFCDLAESCTGTSASCPANSFKPDQTACTNSDPCANSGTCQSGTCVDGSPVTCVAQDECHSAGFCDHTSGACAEQVVERDGTPCTGGACLGGSCRHVSAGSATPTAIDPTVPTDLMHATAFLYEGPNASQVGVSPGTIVRSRVGIIRGKVVDTSGDPITGASVVSLGHPEYGVTVTNTDGTFSFALNGDEQIRIAYQAKGYLPVQRTLFARELEYSWAPDVVLTSLDSASTVIALSSPNVQTALATPVADGRGLRQSILVFLPGTQATAQNIDGSSAVLTSLTVRSTEYTAGTGGPKAMPAPLPPGSGYTYAANLRIDEASGGTVKGVQFSQPVINYVDNFLHFPVGTPIPFGHLEPTAGSWVADPNGRIIKVLDISSGMAQVDTDGDGVADGPEVLGTLGITAQEQSTLANLYAAGTTIWRVPTSHFSDVDYNLSVSPPDGTTPPADSPSVENDPDSDPCEANGSIVDCNNQILKEKVPLVGVPFSLVYTSARAPGYAAGSALLNIPLSSSTPPSNLTRIELTVNVAGHITQQTFPPLPNQTTHVAWLGTDGFGRPLVGRQWATVSVIYIYNTYYQYQGLLNSEIPYFFNLYPENRVPPAPTDAPGPELTFGLVSGKTLSLQYPNARLQEGLGGWSLNIHHSYDPATLNLIRGDGTQSPATPITAELLTNPSANLFGWDFLPAPGGGFYLSNVFNFPGSIGPNLAKVDPTGAYSVVAAGAEPTYLALDGADVVFAHQVEPFPNFLSEMGMVERLTPAGTVSVVAGSASSACASGVPSGDEGPALDACLGFINGVAVAPDRQIYILTRGNASTPPYQVRRVDGAGAIHNVLLPEITNQYAPISLGVGPDYGIHLLLQPAAGDRLVQRLQSDGTLLPVAGMVSGSEPCSDDDGSEGIRHSTCDGLQMQVGPDGTVYLLSQISFTYPGLDPLLRGAIVKVLPDGRLAEMFTGLKRFNIRQFKVGSNGEIVALAQMATDNPQSTSQYWGPQAVYRLRHSLPGVSDAGYVVPAVDGSEVYYFDGNGRHLKTTEALAGYVKYQFSYSPEGYVAGVTDRNGLTTTIERDGSGTPTGITAPSGQQTVLALDTSGYLRSVASPGGANHTFQYSNGLLTGEVDDRSGIHTFTYDANGRLIQDQNPIGGGWTLSDERGGNTRAVTMSSGAGRARIYTASSDLGGAEKANADVQGNRQRTFTKPSGLSSSAEIDSQNGKTTTSIDGTVTERQLAGDPRFGMAAPFARKTVVTTPNGVTAETDVLKTAAVASDGVTLTSQTNTRTTNGHVSTTTYDGATRTTTSISAGGRQRLRVQDGQGRIVFSQSGGLAGASLQYDALGRVSTVTVGSGATARQTSFSYDGGSERVTSILGRVPLDVEIGDGASSGWLVGVV